MLHPKLVLLSETNFRTQIAKGYKYPDKDHPISTFMAPAYLTTSLGMDYKPNKIFVVSFPFHIKNNLCE